MPAATQTPSVRDKVQSVINLIRPAVQADGGDIELVDVNDAGVVQIRFHGACHGCPSSNMTLKDGIIRPPGTDVDERTKFIDQLRRHYGRISNDGSLERVRASARYGDRQLHGMIVAAFLHRKMIEQKSKEAIGKRKAEKKLLSAAVPIFARREDCSERVRWMTALMLRDIIVHEVEIPDKRAIIKGSHVRSRRSASNERAGARRFEVADLCAYGFDRLAIERTYRAANGIENIVLEPIHGLRRNIFEADALDEGRQPFCLAH